jgi:hypothetical protein
VTNAGKSVGLQTFSETSRDLNLSIARNSTQRYVLLGTIRIFLHEVPINQNFAWIQCRGFCVCCLYKITLHMIRYHYLNLRPRRRHKSTACSSLTFMDKISHKYKRAHKVYVVLQVSYTKCIRWTCDGEVLSVRPHAPMRAPLNKT